MTPSKTDDIYLRVRKILARMLKVNENMIRPEALLKDDLGVDSVDIVDIVSRIEEEFNIEIEDQEIALVNKVEDAVHLIKSKME